MAGDRYLICSDGLTRFITDHQISMIASPDVYASAKQATRALLKAALDAETSDNISVVIIDFQAAR